MHNILEDDVRRYLVDPAWAREALKLTTSEIVTPAQARLAILDMLHGRRPVSMTAAHLPFDAATSRLLANAGVHPHALAVLAAKRDLEVGTVHGLVSAFANKSRVANGWNCRVALGVDGRWDTRCLRLSRLPETVVCAMETRVPAPVATFATHPLMEGVEAEVIGLRPGMEGDVLLDLDVRPGCSRIEMLIVWNAARKADAAGEAPVAH